MSSKIILFFLIISLNFSCSHYQILDYEKLPFNTIHISEVRNDSFAPNIESTFNKKLREAILSYGKLRISKDESNSDVDLSIIIKNYDRNSATRNIDDAGRINSLMFTLSAVVSLYDNSNQKYLIKEYVLESSENIYFPQDQGTVELMDFQEAEYSGIPRLCDNLINQVMDLIVGIWSY